MFVPFFAAVPSLRNIHYSVEIMSIQQSGNHGVDETAAYIWNCDKTADILHHTYLMGTYRNYH